MDHDTEMSRTYVVIKLNPYGEETWRYSGRLICQDDHSLVLEAFFDREDTLFHGMLLAKGDRFLETYYADRWYNIFEIHSREDDHLRGWYCNIATPVEISDNQISYIDLALDLIVFPDGQQLILDEREFEQLEIAEGMRTKALQALLDLQALFSELPDAQPGLSGKNA
jgi:uncharacterized protein